MICSHLKASQNQADSNCNTEASFCMEHSFTYWVPDVYYNDVIMYMVYLVHVYYMYQIMFVCHSSTTVHVYDLLHKKLSTTCVSFSHIKNLHT